MKTDSKIDIETEKRSEAAEERSALILLPSLEYSDGSAGVLMTYYESLVRSGWQVDFLLIQRSDNDRTKQVKASGGKIYVLPPCNKYMPAVEKKITSVISGNRYTLIHVNFPGHAAYLALKRAEQSGIRVRIFHSHNPKNNLNLKARLSTSIYDRVCFRHANRYLACSESTGLSRYKGKRFRVLRNAVSTEKYRYDPDARAGLRKKLNLEDAVVTGVVGRMTEQKNPLFLIECFAAFHAREPRARLLWIGEGELEKNVKDRLKEMNLMQACIFPGFQEDTGPWYSAMDLFLLPSKFEGLGIVFIEAQCSGLPCFGSDQVPEETEITDLMHRISLQRSPDEWAEIMSAVLRERNAGEEKIRRDRSSDVRDAGYDRSCVREDLVRLYHLWTKELDDESR